jgi:hypothetical protein
VETEGAAGSRNGAAGRLVGVWRGKRKVQCRHPFRVRDSWLADLCSSSTLAGTRPPLGAASRNPFTPLGPFTSSPDAAGHDTPALQRSQQRTPGRRLRVAPPWQLAIPTAPAGSDSGSNCRPSSWPPRYHPTRDAKPYRRSEHRLRLARGQTPTQNLIHVSFRAAQPSLYYDASAAMRAETDAGSRSRPTTCVIASN